MIVVLTGAKKNIGDYLIGYRAKALLRRFVDDDILELPRFENLNDRLDIINSSRALVLCGGPAYGKNIYPGIYPLVEDLDQIKVPIVPYGLGWSGKPAFKPEKFEFSEQSEKIVKKIHQGIPYSSCRDNLTLQILNRYGIENVLMTGCPVWYDLSSIGKKFSNLEKIRRVVFTTPANAKLAFQSIQLMRLIKRIYPDSEMIVSFHRGIFPDSNTRIRQSAGYIAMAAFAKCLGAKVVDVSYDMEKIKFYDECDFHIGYRVHAHLYFLSKRIPSLLINEDGRGLGQAMTLGLVAINCNDDNIVLKVENLLREYCSRQFTQFNIISDVVDNTFNIMKSFLEKI